MSKLGLHVSAGNRRGFGDLLKDCADSGSPVPVVFSVDQDVWPDIEEFSPQTIVVFRHQNNAAATGGQDGPGDAYRGDPVQSARTWMAANQPAWRKNKAHYYAPLNEQDPGTLAGFEWLNLFTLECMRIAEADGYKLALYGFSGGNPKDVTEPAEGDPYTLEDAWTKLLPSLQHARTAGHIMLLHEYGFGSPAANDGPATSLRASAPHLALRYRRSIKFLYANDADVPVVIGEAGAGVGGFGVLGKAGWLADAQWYDGELMRDRVVIGCCLYQVGGDENIRDGLPNLASYVSATPTPLPESGDLPVIGLDGQVDPPPAGRRGAPRLDYARVVYTPDGGTRSQRLAVIDQMLADGVGEYSQSFDSAMIGDLSARTVQVFGAEAGRQAAIATWRDTFYPGVKLVFKPWPGATPVTPPIASAGWCPFAARLPLTNHAYWTGRSEQVVKAVVLHSAEGPLTAVYPWFNRVGSQQSAHFCIARTGLIEQYVSISDAAWANGKVSKPTWRGLIASVNPNLYTISIEMEGVTTEPRTPAMWSALVRLLGWLSAQTGLTWTPHETLIGHCEIDGVNRANDPGPSVDFSALAHAANGGVTSPPAALDFKSGVGVGNPQRLTTIELEAIRLSRVGAVKLMTLADPVEMRETIEAVRRVRQDMFIVARLFYKPDDERLHRFDAQEFVNTVLPGLAAAYQAGVRYFEVHNEPNLDGEGNSWNWSGGREFNTWLLAVLRLLREKYPDAKLGYPGLSPQPNTLAFLDASREAVQACDWLGAHAYWQFVGDEGWGLYSPDGGWYWQRIQTLFPDKLLMITEFSNNAPEVDYTTKAKQYAVYFSALKAGGRVGVAFAFALSWPGQDANHEAWVVNDRPTSIPNTLEALLK